jgi:hypothetical protein
MKTSPFSPPRNAWWITGAAICLLGIAGWIFFVVISGPILFKDDFKGRMNPKWRIMDEDPTFYSITASGLDLRASHDDIRIGQFSAPKNMFLIPNPAKGDFTATLKIKSFVPAEVNHAQIDVLALDDQGNMARANYGYIIGQHQAEFGVEVASHWAPEQTPVDMGGDTFYLRLNKNGNIYFQSYSTDGKNYTTINQPRTFSGHAAVSVGFCAGADPSDSSHIYIDSFTVKVPAKHNSDER